MNSEVLVGPERRRRWSLEEKSRVVAETLAPGVTTSAVARRYGISPSLLFFWRRQAREGRLTSRPGAPGMVAVNVVADATPLRPPPGSAAGVMEIDLGAGRCVRVDRHVDAAALDRVLSVLARRA